MNIRVFARRWWLVVLGAVLGVTAGVVLTVVTPKSYTATATLFVGSPASTDASIAYNLDLFSQQRALTYAKLAQSREIATAVQKDLDISITPEQLAAKVTASPVLKTVLMRISASDGSPKLASDIANSFATEFTRYVTQLETPTGASQPSTAVTVIQQAEVPTSSTSPKILLNVLVGLVVGVVLGLFVKWLLTLTDRKVRSSKDLAEATGESVLGVLPKDVARNKQRLDLASDSTSPYAEALRRLRANLLYADVNNQPKSIAFLSPRSTMSTTATATNLAMVLDGAGRRVGLVDADMREARLSRYVDVTGAVDASNISAANGRRTPDRNRTHTLLSVLTTGSDLDDSLRRIPGSGVDVLTTDAAPNAAGDVLASDALAKLLAELRSRYDFVFCDAPGVLTANDGTDVGRDCDAVVLVATAGKDRIDDVAKTTETIRRLGINLVGAVLTDARL